MTNIRHILILGLFFLWAGHLSAAHIVGGGMTYECLGGTGNERIYRFTMKIYRDCSSTTQLDNQASIAVYRGTEQNNTQFTVFTAFRGPVQTVSINQPDCIDNLPNICLEEATYTWERTLPVSNQSYFVEYQRCCRTASITNILNPDDVGATYFVEITPAAQQVCNSSPVFNNFPPVVVCNNYPLEVDYSATDADGDQLVYSFCAPYAGGGGPNGTGCNSTAPSPPCPPPFDLINFIAPFYSASQPMGGDPVVQIGAQSGVISGTPRLNGQFVVGVCVQEFRNGQLLSVTRRDFQFNVAPCAPQVTATIANDEITSPQHYVVRKCDGTKTVTIDNQSTLLANITDFEWTFDLGNGNILHNTTDFDITVNFPDYGTYNGTLILNKSNEDCGDTAYVQVQLYAPVSAINLGPDVKICNDTTTLVFDAGTGFASYQWQDGSASQTFTTTNPGLYYVAAVDECNNILRDSVLVSNAENADQNLVGIITYCPGDSVTLDVPGFDDYNWSPAAGLSCTDCPIVYAFPEDSTTYTLYATNADGCIGRGTFQISVLPTPGVTRVIEFYGNESVTLGGQVYTESDTILLEEVSTTGGCDSLNTYILKLIPTIITVSCPANITVALPGNDTTIPVNYDLPSGTSDCPDANISIQLLEGSMPGADFPAGVNSVCFEGTNTCGDLDTCCFTITVSGLIINCPANITVALPGNSTTVPVNYDLPSATTDCPDADVDIQLLEGLVPGADFSAGVNTVCFEASTACGNLDSCCFTVTVNALELVCPANITVALPNNTTSIAVNYDLPTATTDCADANVSVQLSEGLVSGADFPAGVNTVCFEASTSCGNLDSCCFTVSVTTLDLVCPANITVAVPNNANTVVVNYAAPLATTNCSDPLVNTTLSQGLASGAAFPAGVTNVCYNATNTCGNANSCCFTVTATTLDIQCPPNVSVQLPVAATSIAVNYAAPTTTGTCADPATVTLLQGLASGSLFPLGINKVCYEAINTCGNRDTCCFNVTVQEAPKACDTKNLGCMRFELLDIRLDSITQRRYRVRVTNFCASEVDYIAVQLPDGVVAVTPKEGGIYTAPNTGNQYLVRNPNASPFYSIRYRSVAAGLKSGESDVLEYRLPQQCQPTFIHIGARLRNGEFYASHLNTFYCPIEPWTGSKDAVQGRNDGSEMEEAVFETPAALAVRPNPTQGLLLVDLNEWLEQSVQIHIMNAQGQLVMTRQHDVQSDWLELNLDSKLANGLYYLVLQPAGGATATARFILQR